MTRAEETAILLEALEQGFLKPDAVIRWADEVIAAEPKPPGWLIDLSTLAKVHSEDVAAFLHEHAAALPVRRKIELIAVAWQHRLLSLRDALPRLFKITILEREGAPTERIEEPLHKVLVSWDSQEDLDVLDPGLLARLAAALREFLRGAGEMQPFLPYGTRNVPEPAASPNGGPAERLGSSVVGGGPPSVS
jgi:hypothetical protein